MTGYAQENRQQLPKTINPQRQCRNISYFSERPFPRYNNYLMNTKNSLAIILTALLLTDSLNGIGWQGTGSGMNSTVITEIWKGLEANAVTAMTVNTNPSYNAVVNELSARLNALWDPAWNVVVTSG